MLTKTNLKTTAWLKCRNALTLVPRYAYAVYIVFWREGRGFVRALPTLFRASVCLTLYLALAGYNVALVDDKSGGVFRDETTAQVASNWPFRGTPAEAGSDFEPILPGAAPEIGIFDLQDAGAAEMPTLPPVDTGVSSKPKPPTKPKPKAAPKAEPKPEKPKKEDVFEKYGLEPMGG